MKTRGLSLATVSRRAEQTIAAGHPWVYDSEVVSIEPPCADGNAVDLVSSKGKYIATALFNSHSKIRLRVISTNANEPVDDAFFERRLRRAVDYRRTVMGDQFSCCRLVFGESDGLPGLTVDRFSDVLVTQTLSLGLERRKEAIFTSLVNILREGGDEINGVFERNDVSVRGLEGMEQNTGWLPLACTPGAENHSTDVLICENGVRYHVDIANGQKTGFFLDQKFNRRAVANIAKGKRVLDCFTHTGSFALNAALAGAASVAAADISQDAIDNARANAQLNGVEDMEFLCCNVFDLLPTLKPGAYDFIILDPPAFTKSRSTIESALKGYKEINLRAMKLLPSGGYLATCSCSHFVTDALFRGMLQSAAADAGVRIRQIEARQQAADHPILWSVPETEYLKFYIFQKM